VYNSIPSAACSYRRLARDHSLLARVRRRRSPPSFRPKSSKCGGGGSCSTRIADSPNDLSEPKRPTSEIGKKAVVQVQNSYSPRSSVTAT